MERLKQTLEEVMRGLCLKNDSSVADPETWLKKALTKKELGHIKVKYFHKGILGLSIDSSAWLYVLSLKKEELILKLQKENAALKNIVLSIGEV